MPDILIFDDDPHVAALLGEVLRERNFTVAHYPSADGVMQIVQETRPRLVVLDIMMPGLDGLSACRDIRSNLATRHVKIVVITAKQFEQDRAVAMRYGVSLFLHKPFDSAKLARDIGRLLGAPQDSPGAPAAPAPPLAVTLLAQGAVVETADLWIFLDAGAGLGAWVSAHGVFPRLCWALLSRYDAGAIEELGACAAPLAAGSVVKLAGPDDADSSLPRLASRLGAGLPLHGMKAPLVFPQRAKTTPLLYPLREGEFLLAPGALGRTCYTHHPGSALAYRFELNGRKLVYCPCNEIRPEAASWNQHEFEKFRSLFRGADLVIHGYGRSLAQPRPSDGLNAAAWEPAVDLAAQAGARRLLLLPLPGASTQDVARSAQARAAARGSPMRCALAVPGQACIL
ncbi:MAG: response regulator [Elusimicrobia bacterium]|nr:response regulator [Elusimicrobiota bacterium]